MPVDFRDVEAIAVARVAEDERLGVKLLRLLLFRLLRKALFGRKSHQSEEKEQRNMFQNIFHALLTLFKFLIKWL